jgi:hypothetical protein
VVLAHASEFIHSNAGQMDITTNSPKNAFKWLQLADAANLADACKACVDRIVGLGRSACKVDTLQGLSPHTLMYMVERLATQGKCRYCGADHRQYCSSCGRYDDSSY